MTFFTMMVMMVILMMIRIMSTMRIALSYHAIHHPSVS